jgi:hypothetical protein
MLVLSFTKNSWFFDVCEITLQPRQMVLFDSENLKEVELGWLCYITNHFTMHIHRYHHLFWSSKYEAIKDNFGGGVPQNVYMIIIVPQKELNLRLFVASLAPCLSLSLSLSLSCEWDMETTERLINVSPLIHTPNIYKLHTSSCCCCCLGECLYFVHPFLKLQN